MSGLSVVIATDQPPIFIPHRARTQAAMLSHVLRWNSLPLHATPQCAIDALYGAGPAGRHACDARGVLFPCRFRVSHGLFAPGYCYHIGAAADYEMFVSLVRGNLKLHLRLTFCLLSILLTEVERTTFDLKATCIYIYRLICTLECSHALNMLLLSSQSTLF